MGDKTAAKSTVQKIGLPLVPGSPSNIKSKEEALKIAKKIGYPVIIKAAAGGGGKGMRICHNEIKLVSSFTTAQTEAEANFGNPNVYIEKYVEKPRHVEIQLLGDKFGRVVHFGERDCSIQRRHQKLLEESPSVALDHKTRRRISELAVKAARAVNYVGAGTMEFLVDKNRNFYFMEMNTRIQVEHPVSEMVTGVDLIKEQIKVAAGEKLRLRQEDIKFQGHAIECRINAEDPDNNFMPCPGVIEWLHLPGGPHIRIDTHVYQGYTVPPYYDSMLAKVIAYGKDRQEAIRIMRRALNEFNIGPIKTTIPFHLRLLESSAFIKGDVSTHFVQEMFSSSQESQPVSNETP
jgi:acetyl-CoA carboxylase biotin carboxylase subunit